MSQASQYEKVAKRKVESLQRARGVLLAKLDVVDGQLNTLASLEAEVEQAKKNGRPEPE